MEISNIELRCVERYMSGKIKNLQDYERYPQVSDKVFGIGRCRSSNDFDLFQDVVDMFSGASVDTETLLNLLKRRTTSRA